MSLASLRMWVVMVDHTGANSSDIEYKNGNILVTITSVVDPGGTKGTISPVKDYLFHFLFNFFSKKNCVLCLAHFPFIFNYFPYFRQDFSEHHFAWHTFISVDLSKITLSLSSHIDNITIFYLIIIVLIQAINNLVGKVLKDWSKVFLHTWWPQRC